MSETPQTVTINQAIEIALNHHQSGQLQEAESVYQQVLQVDPKNASVLNLLGLLAYQRSNYVQAAALLRQAIAVNQIVPEFYNHLGLVFHAQGQWEEAIVCYRQALQLKPDFVEVQSNLGSAFKEQGRWAEAVASYQQALKLQPNFAEVYNNLGAVFKIQNRWEEAENYYRQAIQFKPDFVEAHDNLGNTLEMQGKFEEAIRCYQQVLVLKPSDVVRVKLATALPVIMGTPQEVLAVRHQFEQEIMTLLHSHLHLENPVKDGVRGSNFYLVYHGLNDCDLQVKLATFYQRACPSLSYTAPHCQHPVNYRGGRKIKIGFVSHFFKNHTIGTVTKGIIANLSRDLFQVYVFFGSSVGDETTHFIQQHANYSEVLSPVLAVARQQIAAPQLDILFYSDIGMAPWTYFLAFARLAPVQCVTYGHPVTTGIPTVDYFLSTSDLEVAEEAEANSHYSEKLVRFTRPPIFYYKPLLPPLLKTRQDFGLTNKSHLYVCPQTLFRFHPDFDPILAEILARDPVGEVVMIEGQHRHWGELLRKRFRQTLSIALLARIRFLLGMNTTDYLNLLTICDVMLDPFHFSSGNAAYEAFAMGTPIVTLPSRFLRGRITYSLYKKMGVMDCVANSPQHYVEIALRLGTNSSYRQQIKAKILVANQVLYEGKEAVQKLEQFLGSVEAIITG